MKIRRLWLLLAVLTLVTGALAENAQRIVYVGAGTTLNDNPLLQTAALQPGDKVQTGVGGSTITIGDTELQLSPNTIIFAGAEFKSIKLIQGKVTVIAGSVDVSDGNRTTTLVAGQSAARGESGISSMTLPDAPSAARAQQEAEPEPPTPRSRRKKESGVPVAGRGGLRLGEGSTAGWSYWAVTGAMFTSSIANVELAKRCIDQNSCTSIPDPFRSRLAMYGAGLPAEAGVAYLTAYLKGNGKRWWFAPALAVTAANTYVAYHWSTRIR